MCRYREALKKEEVYKEEIVRNEMFLHLDYYVTESSGHNSEYNWWFRKRPDLIEKYCLPGTGWNPGEYAFILNDYLRTEKTWKDDIKKWFDEGAPMSLERGYEYASAIINAFMGGVPYKFNGNVPNRGLISNLPEGACVEVPVVANKQGLNPVSVGALPPQLAALNNINVAVEEMGVEAALTGDARLVFQAICYDPLTAAVLSLAEIKRMVQEMLEKNKPYLPQFKSIEM
jgi:alpha-galactosidase